MTQRSEGELAFATAPTGTLQKMLAAITCLRLCRKVRARGARRHEFFDDVIREQIEQKNCREDPRSNSKARPNLHQLPQQSPAPGGQKEGSISAVAYGSGVIRPVCKEVQRERSALFG